MSGWTRAIDSLLGTQLVWKFMDRYERRSIDASRWPTLDAPDELAPARTLVLAHRLELVAEGLRGFAPHTTMPAHSTLDISTPEDAFERHSLGHRCATIGGLVNQGLHSLKSARKLGDGVIVGPALQRGMGVIRNKRRRCRRVNQIRGKWDGGRRRWSIVLGGRLVEILSRPRSVDIIIIILRW